ncbi:MAG: hypothetical protein AAF547_15080, partial [Actinomycetota bacterium]
MMTTPTTAPTARGARRDRRAGRQSHVPNSTGFAHLQDQQRSGPTLRQVVGLCLLTLVLGAIG